MADWDDKKENEPVSGQEAHRQGEASWWQPALLMFARLSGWIIVPVIVGAFVGQWLDRKYHTDPWLFLASIGVAFVISMVGLVKNALEEMQKVENLKKDLKDKFDKK